MIASSEKMLLELLRRNNKIETIKHYTHLKRFEINASVHKKWGKTVLQIKFTKILLVISLDTLWKCTAFSLGAPDETGLLPEGQSKHKVY